MKELKRLNSFLLKYKGRLAVGLIITIVARLFSLVTPRLVGDSMTTIENYLNLETISSEELREVLLTNIILIIAASLISGFFTFLMRQTIINVSRYIEYDVKNQIYQTPILQGQRICGRIRIVQKLSIKSTREDKIIYNPTF